MTNVPSEILRNRIDELERNRADTLRRLCYACYSLSDPTESMKMLELVAGLLKIEKELEVASLLKITAEVSKPTSKSRLNEFM